MQEASAEFQTALQRFLGEVLLLNNKKEQQKKNYYGEAAEILMILDTYWGFGQPLESAKILSKKGTFRGEYDFAYFAVDGPLGAILLLGSSSSSAASEPRAMQILQLLAQERPVFTHFVQSTVRMLEEGWKQHALINVAHFLDRPVASRDQAMDFVNTFVRKRVAVRAAVRDLILTEAQAVDLGVPLVFPSAAPPQLTTTHSQEELTWATFHTAEQAYDHAMCDALSADTFQTRECIGQRAKMNYRFLLMLSDPTQLQDATPEDVVRWFYTNPLYVFFAATIDDDADTTTTTQAEQSALRTCVQKYTWNAGAMDPADRALLASLMQKLRGHASAIIEQ